MYERICHKCGYLFEASHWLGIYCPGCASARGEQRKAIARQKEENFSNGLHWCSKCKEYKPADEFNNSKRGKFGKHHYCKICHRGSHDPVSTKQYYKDRTYRLKSHYVEEAGGKCQKCGYNEFIAALDFHHINRDEKEYHPQKIINNGNHEMAQTELDKCILLCANCHRGYEGGYWKNINVSMSGGFNITGGEGAGEVAIQSAVDEMVSSFEIAARRLIRRG